jgi:hypothetical protein
MSSSSHTGMDTYHKILTDLRAKGAPIGPEYHKFNKQFKRWSLKQKNLQYLEQAREAKQVKTLTRKALVSLNSAKERIAKVGKQINSEEQLRQKHSDLQRQKIASGLKDNTGRTDYIKSVGNGL